MTAAVEPVMGGVTGVVFGLTVTVAVTVWLSPSFDQRLDQDRDCSFGSGCQVGLEFERAIGEARQVEGRDRRGWFSIQANKLGGEGAGGPGDGGRVRIGLVASVIDSDHKVRCAGCRESLTRRREGCGKTGRGRDREGGRRPRQRRTDWQPKWLPL